MSRVPRNKTQEFGFVNADRFAAQAGLGTSLHDLTVRELDTEIDRLRLLRVRTGGETAEFRRLWLAFTTEHAARVA